MEFRRCLELTPGCRSQVSKVSMIRPTHSAMARQERKPMRPVKMTGAVQLIDSPEAVRAKARAAKGRRRVKMQRRTRWDD